MRPEELARAAKQASDMCAHITTEQKDRALNALKRKIIEEKSIFSGKTRKI